MTPHARITVQDRSRDRRPKTGRVPTADGERPPRRSAGKTEAPRVAVASLVGTTIEYYDFAVYGTASALVLGPAFFPSGNATVSSLAAFLTFAAAFLSRPLGVVLFGTIGDRLGRRRALVASLLLMGVATVGVGLLPTYESAGLLAPVLLVTLRLLQGVSMGGEWGGAVLLAAEHAPPGRRALYASIPQAGPSLGFLLSTAVILPTLNIVGRDGFVDWAWRDPVPAQHRARRDRPVGAYDGLGVAGVQRDGGPHDTAGQPHRHRSGSGVPLSAGRAPQAVSRPGAARHGRGDRRLGRLLPDDRLQPLVRAEGTRHPPEHDADGREYRRGGRNRHHPPGRQARPTGSAGAR